MEKQELRNALCAIEDEARGLRKSSDTHEIKIVNLIVQLAQIIRQEIVK